MSRSIKKGPFCAPELLKRVDEMNEKERKEGPEDLELRLHHLPL